MNTKPKPEIEFYVSDKLNSVIEAGISGLFTLLEIQLEMRMEAGEYTVEGMRDYLLAKIDVISTELAWVFSKWNLSCTQHFGLVKKTRQRIEVKFVAEELSFGNERQEGHPTMCSFTIKF